MKDYALIAYAYDKSVRIYVASSTNLVEKARQIGRDGIRTHVPLRVTAFRVQLVMTTSILFQDEVILLYRI